MFLETLESRAMLSATAFNTQVLQDRLAVDSALLKFKSDTVSITIALVNDSGALQAADLKQDTTLAPLFKQLHKDVKTMRSGLKSDLLNESSAVLKDESVVVAELAKYVSDNGNETARKADRVQLRKDRIQLQNDEIAGLNARLTTRQTYQTKLTDDLNAITTALGTDTGASQALQTAVNQFTTDRTSSLTTLQSDLTGIINARTKLAADLAASLTSTT
jgi:hypothetical protein